VLNSVTNKGTAKPYNFNFDNESSGVGDVVNLTKNLQITTERGSIRPHESTSSA